MWRSFDQLSDPDEPWSNGDPQHMVDELLDILTARPGWHADAVCRGNVGLFFAETWQDQDTAKALCGTCPVSPQCLQDALEVGAGADGVWGGTSKRERSRLRRGRRSAA